MFHNDANTQVGQQFGSQNNFNNHPDAQIGGSDFPSVGGSGSIFNKQSQIGTQFGGRKKREAQFHNHGSQVEKQIGFDGSKFHNRDSQVNKQLASKGADFDNKFSQAKTQIAFGSNADLSSGLPSFGGSDFPSVGGSGSIFNKKSQI